jgi:hypothetical protein
MISQTTIKNRCNYFANQVEPFIPTTQFDQLQGTTSASVFDSPVTTSTSIVLGQPVQCITNDGQTWCLTSQGLFATFSAVNDFGPLNGFMGQLISSTESVSQGTFALPAPPTPWNIPFVGCNTGPCF